MAALDLLRKLLDPNDRRIAEAHLMVALALEYVSVEPEQARTRAIEHAEKSKEVLVAKLESLKAAGRKEDEVEIKDIEEVTQELDMKVRGVLFSNRICHGNSPGQIEDLKTAPLIDAQAEKDKALSAALGKPTMDPSAPVNNLSGLVKKKKKAPEPASDALPVTNGTNGVEKNGTNGFETNGKRKAEDVETDAMSKKARVDDDSDA